jgi:hypothetical protein
VRLKEAATSRKDFSMQNFFVKKRKIMAFLCKRFNSSLVICDAIFFADKNKLIPFILHKIALDTAFSNTMLKIVDAF